MDHKARKYLQDIFEAIISIDEHLQEKRDFNLYVENKTIRRSVERELEIIGEAMNNLLRLYPDIQISSAQNIVDLRNFIIHAYDAVNSGRAIIWRNYDWLNHTENSSLEYEGTNSYLSAWGPLKWIGTSQESWYIFGGLNEKGLGCFNTLMVDFANQGGYSYGNYRPQA